MKRPTACVIVNQYYKLSQKPNHKYYDNFNNHSNDCKHVYGSITENTDYIKLLAAYSCENIIAIILTINDI